MAQCKAMTKGGSPCRRNAVKGYPVCQVHGAGSPGKGRPGGRPIVHGGYSAVIREEEIPTLEELRDWGVALEEEVAVARLQLRRSLGWAKDESRKVCDGKSCPQEVVDRRLALVASVAEKAKRVADGTLVRIVDEAAVGRVVDVIQRHVKDPATLAAIAGELESLGSLAGGIVSDGT